MSKHKLAVASSTRQQLRQQRCATVRSTLQPVAAFVHIIDASLVYTLLRDAANLVVDRVQFGVVWKPQISSDEVGGLAFAL